MRTLLACGHVANSVVNSSIRACAICAPDPRAYQVVQIDIDLSHRTARCACGTIVPASWDLPFFEYRGEGSRAAIDRCRNCGFAEIAHGHDAPVWNDGQTAVQHAKCPGWEPHGEWEHDTYYCGHAGWD